MYRRELTINQIAKNLKKPYASMNKYVHDLILAKVLHKRKIGPSLVCSLNYESSETLAILCYGSIKKALEKDTSTLERQLKKSTGIVFSLHNQLYGIRNKKKHIFKKLSIDEFKNLIISNSLDSLIIFKDAEGFWKLVKEVYAK